MKWRAALTFLTRTTYTWIDTKQNPINLPAPTYIKHIQTWVSGKIQDPTLFPSDTFTSAPPLPKVEDMQQDPNHWRGKSSGFPQRFEHEVKNMFKQMFRCYAHLYWQHWIQFWELSMSRELNTCFVHFMNVGRTYQILTDKDIEPMMPLVELWVKQGVLPQRVVLEDGREAMVLKKAGEDGAGAGTASATNTPA